MNQMLDGEALMHMLNLMLQKQQQKILKGQYIKDDDYID